MANCKLCKDRHTRGKSELKGLQKGTSGMGLVPQIDHRAVREMSWGLIPSNQTTFIVGQVGMDQIMVPVTRSLIADG